MNPLRRLAAVAVWLLVAVLALIASLAYHGQLPLARRTTRDVVNRLVSEEIAGELRIGRVEVLGPYRIVARDVELYDRNGRRAAWADEVDLVPDLGAALRGSLRFGSARLRQGKIELIEGEGLPTLIELFEPIGPPSPGPGLHAVVDDIRLEDVEVEGELLGLEGIRVEGLRVHARLEYDEELEIRIWSASGDMVEPFPFAGRIDRIVGRITDDPYESVDLHVQSHTDTDRARANIRLAVPEGQPPEAPSELDLLIHAMPLQARTLHQMGFEWAELLRGEAYGYLRLHGPTDDLRLRADLETDAGQATLRGRLPTEGESVIRARTKGLSLDQLVIGAPEAHVGGEASLFIAEGDAPARVKLDLDPFEYAGNAVPALEIEGALEEEGFRLDRADGRHGAGRFQAKGQVGYDGDVDVRVGVRVPQIARDPNLARLFPGARGGLEGDVHLITAADEGDRLDFHGRIVLRNVEYGPLTADRLALEGFARGDPERPEARIDVDGRGVAMGGYPLGTADLKLRGGPREYETIGRFSAPGDRRLELDARIQASREKYVLDADHIEFAVGERVWRGTSERVVIRPDRDVAVEHLVIASGSERLEVEGVYRFDGPEHFEAQLQNFDLTGLRALFDDQAPTVTGHADAHLTVEGDLTEPDLLVEGALRGASYHGVDDVDLVYVLTYGEGQLALDAQADLQERGNVAVTSTGYIDPSEPDLAVALEDGVYEVDVAVADLDLQLLRSALGEDAVPPVSGHLVGRMTASGPIQAPSFESSLHVPELGLPNWPELGVRSNVSYRDGALNGHIVTEDDHGELAEVEGNLLIDLVHLIEHPEDLAASLEVVPWRVSVRLPTRTLGTLPQSLRKSVPEGLEPLEVAMSATLSGGGFQTRGDLTAHLGWDEDFSLRPCGAEAHPRATITGSLKDGVTDFELVGQVGREAVAYAEASASTPLDDWLHEGEPPGLPAVAASAQLRQLDLGKVPWVCERFDGPVSGEVEMADLFTDDPRAEANLATNGLIVRRFQDRSLQGAWTLAFETAPFEGALELSADHEHLEGTTGLSWWNGGEAQVLAHLPLIWNADHPVPEVEGDSPLQLEADLDDVPLALVLSVIPNLVDVEGTVSGRLATSGQLDDPALRGELAIRNGYFQLMPMGQQVRNVEGDLVFHGDWVELRQLVAQEREGELKIRGAVQLDGIRPSSGQLALEADTFPVRSEGAVLAKVTGEASVDAEMDPDRSTAHVTLRDLSLALPDEGLRSIQGLEPHPDVQVQGNTEPREQTEEDPYPIVIGIDSANPFWVRRSDFSALVSMDLGVTYLDPDLYVDGSVKIGRGFFEVFGKRFDVEQASLDFDGASEINPEVNLQAVHKLRSGGADTVNVTVTGRLARPRVEFATTVVGCQERGQVIALLITGRCARSGGNEGQGFEQAGQQAASFLAGVAYGVLTLSAREQLGDKFPMIVIESGTGGRPVVRAGIDASEIIPKPLQSIVQSAYVEGFFTASREEDQARTSAQGGQDNGFLLELQFPRNIVGTGVFSPPDNWSVDFTWEP